MKPSATSIPGLTPLRGIAALLVAVFHVQVYCFRFVQKEQSMFLDKGYLMVDLFFMMSGFLILHVYKEEFQQHFTLRAFKKFMLARFARLYPLHIITLLVLVIVFYVEKMTAGGYLDPHAILTHIFLLQTFPINGEATWNIPSWSISAEWWTYTLFPFLCLLLFRKRKLAVIMMIAVIAVLYISIIYLLPRNGLNDPAAGSAHNLDLTSDYGFLRSVAGFMSGMLLYILYSKENVKRFFNSDRGCILMVVAVITALHFGIDDVYFVPLFAILVLFITSNTNKFSQAFNNKPLTYLGDISYSVYMLHFLFIFFMKMVAYKFGHRFDTELQFPFWTGLVYCLGYVAALVIISGVSYRFIEKPCRRYINDKWGKKLSAAKAKPVSS
ncbi:MAG: acyltransferase [Bacteroidetes bacterium]|nr:acyltransferase [Bacteroidota bacterium]